MQEDMDGSRTSQILFLHLLFSLICFATKTMPSLKKPSGGRQPQSPPKKASDTASTSSLSRQPGWLRCEEQRRQPERKQVFVLLANTLLAPTRTNRVLPSGGRVLSSKELHLEPIATTAKIEETGARDTT